jgi:hypothetical protein
MLEELSELEYHHFKQVNHHLYHLWAIFNSYIEFSRGTGRPHPDLCRLRPKPYLHNIGRWVYTNIRHNQARYITDNRCTYNDVCTWLLQPKRGRPVWSHKIGCAFI